ncbi:beta family protein [Bacillus atrophaeus]|uniref:beta family protein n=1 Tax=Bacillus atrophaeus TaxID=1452 RepID=UPI00227DC11F|nr:beta family protein [Bacillus atrophaeus]MCY8912543.1 beta family protein [Bacillus atrophaeus]MCY9113959.1 beta family protein [Bacillus atrophaeus]MEC0927096.1 beta family protein [Bacillus atrophaeus]MEC0932064.1 beta family protein [Bacillus atrophaeus]
MFNENHYVPVLRWKRGEQNAIKELDDKIKNKITPLVEIPPIDWDFENECPKKTIDEHIKNFASQLKNSWGSANTIFIDAFQICIDDEEMTVNKIHPLKHIFDSLLKENLNAIAVICPNCGLNYEKAVHTIIETYDTGYCLRLSDKHLDNTDELISTFLIKFPAAPEKIDVILDYRYIDPNHTSRMSSLVAGTLLTLPYINDWRTLTFIGTSVPENLSSIPTGTDGRIPRSEWLIYKKLLSTNLSRFPSFGDYVISNPEYISIDPRLIQMAANIRYTSNEDYLFFRGHSVRSPKFGKWQQAQTLCKRLIEHHSFYGKDYSYGDNYIYECAHGRNSTGNAETWRKVGTNHHLTLASNQLSSFHDSLVARSH